MNAISLLVILAAISDPSAALRPDRESLESATPQILFRIQVVEISHTKCRQAGLDFPALGNDDRGACLAPDDPQQAVCKYVDFLVQNQLARTLAEPTLITTAGRNAKFCIGGELPPIQLVNHEESSTAAAHPPKSREFGTSVELTDLALRDDTVQTSLRVRIAELVDAADAAAETPLHVRELDITVEIPNRHTLMLPGTTACDAGGDQTELVLIVTPELVR